MSIFNEKILSREHLLREARIKRDDIDSDYIKDLLYYLSIDEFVLLLYVKCSPSVYGKMFEKKLYITLERLGLYIDEVSKGEESGDVSLYYPRKSNDEHILVKDIEKTDDNIITHSITMGKLSPNVFRSNYEIKFSYLGKNLSYSIKNIRLYHDFDYFIFVFVDVYNDFKLEYYCIKKYDIELFSLSYMNGTHKSNVDNKNINYGTTIGDGTLDYRVLNHINLLKGNTIEDLIRFMVEDTLKLRDKVFDKISKEGVKVRDENSKYSKKVLRNFNTDDTLFDIQKKLK
jgi:hypothetical protein